MTRDVGDPGDLVALCRCPSARPPPPLRPLLKTKAKPQFDRAVDRAVEALFSRISQAQSRMFRLVAYSVFKERPPETISPEWQCCTLPFVRLHVKKKLTRLG